MKKITILILIILSIALAGMMFFFINLNKNNMKEPNKIKLTSEAFEHNQPIPNTYSCRGKNINPPLSISGTPKGAKSLALIVDDPDAPIGDWVHWLVWNISPSISKIEEASVPDTAIQGLNDSNKNEYDGPCPPSGTHRYFFKLYALDINLDIDKNSRKKELLRAMEGHILDQTELIGLYSK